MNKMKKPEYISIIGEDKELVHNFLLRILIAKKYYRNVKVVCSNDSRQFYEQIFDKDQIYKNIEDEIIESRFDENGRWKTDEMLLILDNDTIKATEETFTISVFNGRHYSMSIIFVSPSESILTPEIRANIDYHFLLKNNNIDSVVKYHQYFGNGETYKSNFEEFYEMFENITNCGVMVVNNCGISTNFLDRVFWYSENSTDDIIIGKKMKSARTI